LPSIDSLSLLKECILTEALIAAGGIADARGIRAALALGAEGVQMDTAFLACENPARIHSTGKRSSAAKLDILH
jgi:nitronate monooxygenase